MNIKSKTMLYSISIVFSLFLSSTVFILTYYPFLSQSDIVIPQETQDLEDNPAPVLCDILPYENVDDEVKKEHIPVITLFSHGIADTYKQVYLYAKSYKKNGTFHINNLYLINTPYVSFSYPDATNKFYRVNWNETSFGQKNEINRLHLVYQRIMDEHKGCGIILFGLSRGASNLGIFAGLHQLDNIKAIILESPYNTMTEVIENMMHRKGLGWLDISYGETLAESIFKKYDRNGWSPKNCADRIPKDIPILIICSKEDETVPCSSSINLYKNLVASGHKHTYILITDHGHHAKILYGADGKKYHATINAFYKKYNLSHCPISAAQGDMYLASCQPTL